MRLGEAASGRIDRAAGQSAIGPDHDAFDPGLGLGQLGFAMALQGNAPAIGFDRLVQLSLTFLKLTDDALQFGKGFLEIQGGDVLGNIGHGRGLFHHR